MNPLPSAAWERPFIPARLTPLPFTPVWSRLTAGEQLRYNQLHGLYFHEQIIFFEQRLIVPLLTAARRRLGADPLGLSLETFIAEENRHSRDFARVLADLRPEWYADTWRHFLPRQRGAEFVLGLATDRPWHALFLIWLIQLLEERTLFAGRLYLAAAERFPDALVATQRQHLSDEAGHVQWDIALIARFWPEAPLWLRRANVRLLDWMLGEFIAVPRRAALGVIDALAADLPGLSVPPGELKAALRTLADREDFRGSIFARDTVPRVCRQAGDFAEFAAFTKTWLACDHAP
jgi:hypothetical protein